MISVENFYWVLYHNLLGPTGLDCWYYHPWGTKKNLSQLTEFKSINRFYDYNHALFHFDQEPLWDEDLGDHYNVMIDIIWSCKFAKFLANSEHSAFKKKLCKDRGMLDWYFFYHGFAALDWFQDARYIDDDHEIKNSFLSFNHIVSNHRSYRIALLARLIKKGVIDKGSVSFHSDRYEILNELQDPMTYLSKHSIDLVRSSLPMLHNLPWKLDDVEVSGNLSARFGHQDYRLWQSSLLHIVNETVFYQPKLHLTEKIFKPIVAQRPFILVAAPGNLEYLKSYGFQTFDRWIDESYDNIWDPDLRLDIISSEIARFAVMDTGELKNVHREMMTVLEHNRQHFFGEFRRIIVNELVNNFETCIRIWNHRVPEKRQLIVPEKLDQVKQILLS